LNPFGKYDPKQIQLCILCPYEEKVQVDFTARKYLEPKVVLRLVNKGVQEIHVASVREGGQRYHATDPEDENQQGVSDLRVRGRDIRLQILFRICNRMQRTLLNITIQS